MKLILCVALMFCLAAPAHADERLTAASLKVRTSDLDLASPKGVDQLANRILRRMWSICGHPTEAGLAYALTGGGLKERQACKERLAVSPGESEGVRKAFAAALERMH